MCSLKIFGTQSLIRKVNERVPNVCIKSFDFCLFTVRKRKQRHKHRTNLQISLYWCLISMLKSKHQTDKASLREPCEPGHPYMQVSSFQPCTYLAHCPHHTLQPHLPHFRVEKAYDLPPKGKPRSWDWESLWSQSRCFWTPEGATKTFGLLTVHLVTFDKKSWHE